MSPGQTVSFNGTVQELVAKISKDHPESEFATSFNSTLANVEARMLAGEQVSAVDSAPSLFKRDDVICCNFGKPCQNDIIVGITYLRGVSGQPTNGPGPGNCGRVSCSFNSAIWWCNDVSDSIYPLTRCEKACLTRFCTTRTWSPKHFHPSTTLQMERKLSSTAADIRLITAHAVSAGIATLRLVVKIFTLTTGMLSSVRTSAEMVHSYRYMLPYGLRLGINPQVDAQKIIGGSHVNLQGVAEECLCTAENRP